MTMVLWLRSVRHCDVLTITYQPKNSFYWYEGSITTSHGIIRLEMKESDVGDTRRVFALDCSSSPSSKYDRIIRSPLRASASRWWERLGFSGESLKGSQAFLPTQRYYIFQPVAAGWARAEAPYWSFAALFAILPIGQLIVRSRRRALRNRSICTVCGYDIRITPDQCPECGHIVSECNKSSRFRRTPLPALALAALLLLGAMVVLWPTSSSIENHKMAVATPDELATNVHTIEYPIGDLLQSGWSSISRQELFQQLTRLICDTVDPESWQSEGGKIGVIRLRGNALIITQTTANQRMITNLLQQLREQRPKR